MAKSKGTTGTKVTGIDNTMFIPKLTAPISMTPAGKKVWKVLIETIPNENIIPSDLPIMEAYCETTVAFRKAVQKVSMDGIIIDEKMNPEAVWMDKCSSKLAVLAAKLRLSPSARQDKSLTKGKGQESVPTTPMGKLIHG